MAASGLRVGLQPSGIRGVISGSAIWFVSCSGFGQGHKCLSIACYMEACSDKGLMPTHVDS